MWLMLQQSEPDDFVIATGETRTVRQFCEMAFAEAGLHIVWKGTGIDEKGVDAQSGKILVEIDPRYFRPTEVDLLIGDASKAQAKLGWKPKTSFEELVRLMVTYDTELARRELRAVASTT
jgi:GDPmannose 4,6-dehydratase